MKPLFLVQNWSFNQLKRHFQSHVECITDDTCRRRGKKSHFCDKSTSDITKPRQRGRRKHRRKKVPGKCKKCIKKRKSCKSDFECCSPKKYTCYAKQNGAAPKCIRRDHFTKIRARHKKRTEKGWFQKSNFSDRTNLFLRTFSQPHRCWRRILKTSVC